jgi:hypothetical protein
MRASAARGFGRSTNANRRLVGFDTVPSFVAAALVAAFLPAFRVAMKRYFDEKVPGPAPAAG